VDRYAPAGVVCAIAADRASHVPSWADGDCSGNFLILGGVLMIVYAKVGKFRHRDRMLKMVDWKGNETVLDVGTGRGLLMIAAAKKLKSGKSVGIDIWSKKDLSGNAMDKTLRNAEIEGVRDCIDVQNGDATYRDQQQ
jgi:arsenite methyltransferase